MWQFLQTYGIWIVFIVVLVLMMRMHGGGMHGGGMHGGGCGMGMGHDQEDEHSGTPRAVPPRDQSADEQRVIPIDLEYDDMQRKALVRDEFPGRRHTGLVRDIPPGEEKATAEQSASPRRRGGC